MPVFRYRTLQPSGAVAEGEIEAQDQQAAVARLQAGGTYPLEIGPTAEIPAYGKRGGKRLSAAELALFTRELATLLGAGLPIDRALGIVGALRGTSRLTEIAVALKTGLAAGESFSALCARQRAFPRLYPVMVAAGEAKGDLAGALDRLATLLERSRAVAQSVVSSLIYPASVMVVALLSTVFLLTFVLPRFEVLLRDLRHELPPATRIMLAAAHGLEAYGPAVLAAILLAALLFVVRLRTAPSFRLAVDRRLLRLPLVGSLILKIEAERFARLAGGLLAADVTVPRALATAREASANRAVGAALAAAQEGIERGDGIAASLAAPGVLPDLLIELARVGEETGRLPEMLAKAGEVLKQEIDVTVNRLVALLTPASTILLGLVVGGLILGVFNAILDAYDLGF